jgi:phosphonate transport system substrate-binding protein
MLKKVLLLMLVFVGTVSLASCEATPEKTNLSVFFVPSRDNATLVQGISYLPTYLKAELAELGFEFETVSVYVGTSYEAVGEALDAGTADIGFIPGGTYAVYADGTNMDVALTATRGGLSKDSDNPQDWNDGEATLSDPEYQVTYYRSLGIAGITDKARALAAKVNAGESLTWEDLQDVKIGVQSPTSSAGRVYPSLLLKELFGYTLADLPAENVIQVPGYGGAAAALASGQVDIAFGYADFRRDYADEWNSSDEGGYGRTETIWDETDVVFVTEGIYNDTITVSKATVNDALQEAIEQAFINLVADQTALPNPAGMFNVVADIFQVYSHQGYTRAQDSDYDGARAANDFINGN